MIRVKWQKLVSKARIHDKDITVSPGTGKNGTENNPK